jgi:ATP-dependent RNA helicase DbpA
LTQSNFSSLKLKPELLKNLKSLDYHKMTPIQEQSLPHILEGKDVIGQAKTGSGKTAAFGLGILENLDKDLLKVQALILCPTRELADQVSQSICQLARTLPNIKVVALCGGLPYRDQVKTLSHGAHIVIGTPGRIAKHLREETLKLDQMKTIVLDEGDRMLEMGFQDELDAIIDCTPSERQTLLFSATYPTQIQAIAKRMMLNPVVIEVDVEHTESSIEQHFYKVENSNRMFAVKLLLQEFKSKSAIIFCNTKKDCRELCDELCDSGFSALDLHGDLDQTDRDETIIQFANGSVSILVATDVAARGIDIDSIDLVINYFVSRDLEVHIHRIGRTGRAGSSGIACSLYSEKEHHKISLLEEFLKLKITSEDLPPNSVLTRPKSISKMATIKLKKGKKQKVGPVNILGALTAKGGLNGKQVGKINVYDNWSYIAVESDTVKLALAKLEAGKLKGFTLKKET